MNDHRLNTFTVNELETLLALVTSYPSQQKTVPAHIIHLDINLQHSVIQLLKTYLADAKNRSRHNKHTHCQERI